MDPARIWALLADIAQHTGSLANGISGTDGKIQSSEGARIPRLLIQFKPHECANYLIETGYAAN